MSVEPDHTESAWGRARRELHQLVTNTIHFYVWAAFWAIAGGAIGLYLAWSHGRAATVVIVVLAAVVGGIAALLIPLGLLWVTAPVRQRNDARDFIAEEFSTPRIVRWKTVLKRLGYQARNLVQDADHIDIPACRQKYNEIGAFLEESVGEWARLELSSRTNPTDPLFEENMRNNLAIAASLLDQMADKASADEILPQFDLAKWED